MRAADTVKNITVNRRGALAASALTVGTLPLLAARSVTVAAQSVATPQVAVDLDGDASQWEVYVDPPERRASSALDNVPAPGLDGTALRLRLGGGDPYTGIQGYYKLPPDPSATAFELSCSFRFTPTTFNNPPGGPPSLIQAIELTMNHWTPGRRFEWGLQWCNVGDGTSQQGQPPTWRLWDAATGWHDLGLGVRQLLAGDQWHTFLLQGDVVDGRVRYVRFACDDMVCPLGHTFAPALTAGDWRPVIAFQLDGNYAQQPYECLFDGVSLMSSPVSPW